MKVLLLFVFLGSAAAGDNDVTTVANNASTSISADSAIAVPSTSVKDSSEAPGNIGLETGAKPSAEDHEKQSPEQNASVLDAIEPVAEDQVAAEDLTQAGSTRYYSMSLHEGDDDDDGVYYRPVAPVIRTTQEPSLQLPDRPRIIPLPLQHTTPVVPNPIHDPQPTPAPHPVPLHAHVPPYPVHDPKEYPDHEPKYEHAYGIKDPQSGINVDVGERRDGDRTEGEYSVLLPDGRTQVVTYYVDKDSGYQAEVKYYGVAKHPDPVAKPTEAREIREHPPPVRKSANYAKTYDYSGSSGIRDFSPECRMPDPSPQLNNVHDGDTVRYYDDNDDESRFDGYGSRKYTTRRHFPGGYAFVSEDSAVCTCYYP